MKGIISFLRETNKLKEIPKRGWVLMGVKNPETVAEHIFSTAISAWILGKERGLNTDQLIKGALFHDLCEVYAKDRTPFFYWDNLDFKKKKDRQKLLLGVRLSKEEKEKRAKIKFEREKRSLLKLVSFLSPDLGKEIFSFWLGFEKMVSREMKFLKQIDRLETLIQSIIYLGVDKERAGTSWLEGTEEILEDELLLDFLKVIKIKFYKTKEDISLAQIRRLEPILDFLINVHNLKRIPRMGWVLRGVKNPETITEHSFTTAMLVYLLSKEKKSLNRTRLLEMALFHNLVRIVLKESTPYDFILKNKSPREKKEILKRWIRVSQKEKANNFLKNYKREKKAIEKITQRLPVDLKREIMNIWEETILSKSAESYFFNQVHILANLFQALFYWQKDKQFPIKAFWDWVMEGIDASIILEFLDELKKNFHFSL